MPKINKEEYEVLKELDDKWKWKWITRIEEGAMKTFTSKPFKNMDFGRSGSWDIKGNEDHAIYTTYSDLFQFIQWEDEEPHNIAELIREYEIKELRLAPSGTVIVDSFDESEETEVLSQEWIDNNSVYASHDGVTEEYIHVVDLKNLIVPKKELPVIPRYVADYLEKAKKEIDLLRVFEIANGLDELEIWRKEYNWIRLYHLDFARAWLDGYEVEEEQKYFVNILDEGIGAYLIYYPKSGNYGITGVLDDVKGITRFTEQEIKDYDERYWAFAVEVAE